MRSPQEGKGGWKREIQYGQCTQLILIKFTALFAVVAHLIWQSCFANLNDYHRNVYTAIGLDRFNALFRLPSTSITIIIIYFYFIIVISREMANRLARHLCGKLSSLINNWFMNGSICRFNSSYFYRVIKFGKGNHCKMEMESETRPLKSCTKHFPLGQM